MTGQDARWRSGTAHLERRAHFIGERFAPDRLATFSGPSGVTGLNHEVADVAVKETVVVGAGSTQGKEVLRRFWHGLAENFNLVDVHEKDGELRR